MNRNSNFPSETTNNHIPQLDGVRGLAILLVISFHYFGFLKIFSLGWTGVDLFFVLSGYLITSRLQSTGNHDYFRKFYINRALRIFPIYFLTLVIFYAGFNFFVTSSNLQKFNFYNNNWWSFALFCQNWVLMISLPIENHLQHFWSLAVEEQFYLFWPLFLFIFFKKKYFLEILFSLVLISILIRCSIYINHQSFEEYRHFFYNSVCRMDSFMIGGLLYFFQKSNRVRQLQSAFWISLIILIAGLSFTNTNEFNLFTSTIGYTLIAIVFAGLINQVTSSRLSFISGFFNQKWLKLVGKISYGLYVYHWIILRVLYGKVLNLLSFQGNNAMLVKFCSLLICISLTLLVSLVSYFYFEIYFLKLKSK